MKQKYLTLFIILLTLLMFTPVFAQSAKIKQTPTDASDQTLKPQKSTSADSNSQQDLQFNIGDLVEAADYRGAWYKSTIKDIKGDKYKVHFFGWDADWDEWVTAEKIRYSNDIDFGREVEVTQKGVWHKSLIIDERYGSDHLVYYVDLGEEEWVKNERIRDTGAGGWRDGKVVEVLSGKKGDKWRRATILKRRNNEVYVHYEDYEDIWNEWVSEDKIRRIR